MNFYEMFVQGLKPAIYRNSFDKQFVEKLPYLKEHYPYISHRKIALIPEAETYLFFQNERMKEDFLRKLNQISSPFSPDFHRLLGHTLGFPPKAVEYFAQTKMGTVEAELLNKRKVGMYYLGIGCSGDIYDLVENVHWLWDTYQINKEMEVRLGCSMITIPFGKTEMLERIKEEHEQKLVLV
jgi:hypothetical protein